MIYCTSARHHHENESLAYLSNGKSSLEPTTTPLSAGAGAAGMPPILPPETDDGWNVAEAGDRREMGREGVSAGLALLGFRADTAEMAELAAEPVIAAVATGAFATVSGAKKAATGGGACLRSSGSMFLLRSMQKSSWGMGVTVLETKDSGVYGLKNFVLE